MARPLLKKNLARPPGIERKIDMALTQDWATLSRRARETNPESGDFLPSECLVHLLRDAIRCGDDRIARVLMPQLLKRAEANLERTVPDSRMRDAESVRRIENEIEVIDQYLETPVVSETRPARIKINPNPSPAIKANPANRSRKLVLNCED